MANMSLPEKMTDQPTDKSIYWADEQIDQRTVRPTGQPANQPTDQTIDN